MGKGDRAWNRWRKDRQRQKKERLKRQAAERGKTRKAAGKS